MGSDDIVYATKRILGIDQFSTLRSDQGGIDYAALGMSRSNHHYYNLCDCDARGRCLFHRSHGGQKRPYAGEFLTRRGIVRRKHRFPRHSIKSWHHGPQKWWKQMWHQRARAMQKVEMRADPENPVVTPMRQLVDMWDWY